MVPNGHRHHSVLFFISSSTPCRTSSRAFWVPSSFVECVLWSGWELLLCCLVCYWIFLQSSGKPIRHCTAATVVYSLSNLDNWYGTYVCDHLLPFSFWTLSLSLRILHTFYLARLHKQCILLVFWWGIVVTILIVGLDLLCRNFHLVSHILGPLGDAVLAHPHGPCIREYGDFSVDFRIWLYNWSLADR